MLRDPSSHRSAASTRVRAVITESQTKGGADRGTFPVHYMRSCSGRSSLAQGAAKEFLQQLLTRGHKTTQTEGHSENH